MEITNELLAAYAEGNVSKQERKAVRQYLTDHPEELESVMMMMDDFYDLDLDNEYKESDNTIETSTKQSNSDICYNVAAFAPRAITMQSQIECPGRVEIEGFSRRLDDFLNDLGL